MSSFVGVSMLPKNKQVSLFHSTAHRYGRRYEKRGYWNDNDCLRKVCSELWTCRQDDKGSNGQEIRDVLARLCRWRIRVWSIVRNQKHFVSLLRRKPRNYFVEMFVRKMSCKYLLWLKWYKLYVNAKSVHSYRPFITIYKLLLCFKRNEQTDCHRNEQYTQRFADIRISINENARSATLKQFLYSTISGAVS